MTESDGTAGSDPTPGEAAARGPESGSRGIIVIGIGNPFRRDDGVGPAVAERLRAQRLPGVRLAVSGGDAADLIELWDRARLAVVVGALWTDAATPGRIHRLAVSGERPTRGTGEGAPSMAFGEAVALARVLGRLPERLVLFAVEAGDLGFGPGLSPAVAAAAGRVAAKIVSETMLAASGANRGLAR